MAAAAAMQAPPQHALNVKNTFLDIDDGPSMPELRRFKSTPDPVRRDLDDDKEEEDDDDDEDEAEDDAEPPPPAPLYKTKTFDGFEPPEAWTWTNGDPNFTPFGDFSGPPPEAGSFVPGPDGALPAFGMVMVPAEAEPFGPVMGAPTAFVVPDGYVAVPVMTRYTRLAEIMPSGGQPSEEAAEAPPQDTPLPVQEEEPAAEADAPAPAQPLLETAVSGSDLDAAAALLPAPPRAPVLQRTFSVPSNLDRIRWTVDAKKLKSTDREAVSPMFELSFSKMVNFKLMIKPKVVANVRGGASFKKAKGKGSVELRCLDEVTDSMRPVVRFRISVGSGNDPAKQEPPRGPVTHDFTKKAICGLEAGNEEWDFSKAVDDTTQTFVVCLEIMASTAPSFA